MLLLIKESNINKEPSERVFLLKHFIQKIHLHLGAKKKQQSLESLLRCNLWDFICFPDFLFKTFISIFILMQRAGRCSATATIFISSIPKGGLVVEYFLLLCF